MNASRYVVEGTISIQDEGKPATTYGPGQAFHEPPQVVHDAKSGATAPSKILVFQANEKGQPLAIPVK
jgi:quercetin dioxygenase-like cupin family protein